MIELNIFAWIHLILICIVFVSLLVNLVYAPLETEEELKQSHTESIVIILFFLTIFLVGFYCYGMYKCEKSEWKTSDQPYSTENIIAFNDSNLTNGKFYMRSGYIEEDLYYQYMVKLNNGGFIANKVNSSNATLYYTNDNYRVEWYTKTKKFLYWKTKKTYNKIYIPEGSISDEYSIDLK